VAPSTVGPLQVATLNPIGLPLRQAPMRRGGRAAELARQVLVEASGSSWSYVEEPAGLRRT